MDIQRSGKFIAQCRKRHKMTQKQLADKIGVTDKAISRWETGKGFPDVSLLIPLAKALDVSVADIINGEADNSPTAADNAIIEALAYAKKLSNVTTAVILLISGLMLLAAPMYVAGANIPINFALSVCGTLLIIAAVIIFKGGIPLKNIHPKTAGICADIFIAAALILELTPYGAVLVFADGPENTIRQTFSYFDLTPFGYANFFPLLTAMLTSAIAVLAVICTIAEIRKKPLVKLQNAAFVCTVIAILMSLLPVIMFGTRYLSAVGICITLTLLISAVFQALHNRK